MGDGPRAAEEALLAELERVVPTTLEALAASPGPSRVVVPSRSLRRHLVGALGRRRPSWPGLVVVTLRRLAVEFFERAGEAPPRAGAMLDLYVRRAALAEPRLAAKLAALEGGFAPLAATVRDLLDAGLEAGHGRPLAELVADPGVRVALADRPRAEAVFSVAAWVARELERTGSAAGATLLRVASELARARPEVVPPAARWLVHGFADATGSALDLLEVLPRAASTTIVLDLPRTAPGAARESDEPFGAGLRARLAGAPFAVEGAKAAAGVEPAALAAFSALGETGEAREVARRIRAELAGDRELEPERVGVVARDLGSYLAPLRRELGAAAIPFSVEGAGEVSPARREIRALVRLLERRSEVESETVVELLSPGFAGPLAASEILVAFRRLGASTLEEVASLAAADLTDVPLPSRSVLDGEEELGQRRRRVSRAELGRWVRAARSLRSAVEKLPARAAAGQLLRAFAALSRAALPSGGEAALWLAREVARLAAEVPPDLALARDEAVELLARAADSLSGHPAGGEGGGVQVLSVTAARARTFDRLFVVGLRRGLFPRAVAEDPLLPDAVRSEARTLLPDLPVKGDGHAEERFLFDQLLGAAPRVVLSFPAVSDDGTERLVSPLLDRLSWRDASTRALRTQWETPVARDRQAEVDASLSPLESARRAGLQRRREAWASALPAALAESAGRRVVSAEEAASARHRIAVVEEVDPDPATPGGRRRWRELGPFLGRVGPLPPEPLFVTRVEHLVACAWLDFLSRQLGLEPLPDAGDLLPEPLDARRIGEGTHRLLEALLRETLASSPAGPEDWRNRSEPALAVHFPDRARIEEGARAIAGELLASEGLSRWGFETLLASALVERAEVARSDWDDGPRRVVGVELDSAADLTPLGAPLSLRFRADRVEFDGSRWHLVDYKTGRARRVAELARDGRLAEAIAAGAALQPAAYVAAFPGRLATGRFLALAPDLDPDLARSASVDESSAAVLAGLARAALAASSARAAGRFLPRLVDATGEQRGPLCGECELLEACVQEDSGARGRVARWAEARRSALARGERPVGAPADLVDAELFLLPEAAARRREEEP